jgi:hypothetical protein
MAATFLRWSSRLATLSSELQDAQRFLEVAGQNLEQAKAAGRNQVVG